MSGSPPDRARVRPPTGLLGMVALVVAVEAAISGLRVELTTAWADDWRISALAAETSAKEADVLCFGDSLVKYGVLPRVIEARSGLRAYNLAASGGMMPSSYFLLRRALDSGAKPKAVVLDIAALMGLEEKPAKPLNYAELGTVRDCLDLAWTAGDGDLLGAVLLGKVLPSFRWRFEVRNAIQAALDGRSVSQKSALESFRTLWAREDGAQPTPMDRIFHPQENLLIDGLCPEKWACDPKERIYAERFLALAESRGIRVYWLFPPMTPGVNVRRAIRGTDARYDRFVRSITSKHPSTMILDARTAGYDDQAHVDFMHLNRRGASVLSADLADLIAADLKNGNSGAPNPRPLPAYAGRTIPDPPPNIARSRTNREEIR